MLKCVVLTLLGLLLVLNNVDSRFLCESLTDHPNLKLVDYEAEHCGVGANLVPYNATHASLADIPWLLYMRIQVPTFDYQWTTESFCGASLINARYALTSGMCIKDGDLPRKVTVDILEWKLNTEGVYAPELNEIRVEHIAKHVQLYKGRNDIALLRLAKTVDLVNTAHVRPICLPWNCKLQRQGYFAGEYNLSSAGWGNEELRQENFQKDIIQMIPLDVKEVDYCNSRIAEYAGQKELQLCLVGFPDINDVPCKADKGIPIMQTNNDTENKYNYLMVGILSSGPTCGWENKSILPAVATKIISFLRWILDNMYPWTEFEGDLMIGNHDKDVEG